MLTVPKAALAGVTSETSFARFTMSMAIFNEERALSRFLGCWDLVVIVATRGGREGAV